MIPEIWKATDRIFVILDHFLPFYPPKEPENQNFEKMKKPPEDNIILQMRIINYSQWQTIFGHFGLFFALLLL